MFFKSTKVPVAGRKQICFKQALVGKNLGISDIQISTRKLDCNNKKSRAMLVSFRACQSTFVKFNDQERDIALLSIVSFLYVIADCQRPRK